MKTPMPPGVYWCPFCETKPYKSKANLSNHIEEKHEPQKQYHCRDCSRSWNLPLGRSRHLGRSNCSAQHFDSTHHTNKKTLYACGVCIAVFDDFGLRQDHLATHQQGGTGKAAWSKDNLMRGVLSHSSISGSWSAPRHPQTNLSRFHGTRTTRKSSEPWSLWSTNASSMIMSSMIFWTLLPQLQRMLISNKT